MKTKNQGKSKELNLGGAIVNAVQKIDLISAEMHETQNAVIVEYAKLIDEQLNIIINELQKI